jgi:hypothetical protein
MHIGRVLAFALINAMNLVAEAQFKQTDVIPRAGFTQEELSIAYAALMTGPRATRPTWKAVRKTIRRARRGMKIAGSWRSWPSIKEASHENG